MQRKAGLSSVSWEGCGRVHDEASPLFPNSLRTRRVQERGCPALTEVTSALLSQRCSGTSSRPPPPAGSPTEVQTQVPQVPQSRFLPSTLQRVLRLSWGPGLIHYSWELSPEPVPPNPQHPLLAWNTPLL